jgi:hypothetical protein
MGISQKWLSAIIYSPSSFLNNVKNHNAESVLDLSPVVPVTTLFADTLEYFIAPVTII